MPKIKIDVFEDGAPSATITVPAWPVIGASRMLPKIAGKGLQEHIDLKQLAELVKDPQASGVLLDIEDHEDNDRITISIVGDEAKAARK